MYALVMHGKSSSRTRALLVNSVILYHVMQHLIFTMTVRVIMICVFVFIHLQCINDCFIIELFTNLQTACSVMYTLLGAFYSILNAHATWG